MWRCAPAPTRGQSVDRAVPRWPCRPPGRSVLKAIRRLQGGSPSQRTAQGHHQHRLYHLRRSKNDTHDDSRIATTLAPLQQTGRVARPVLGAPDIATCVRPSVTARQSYARKTGILTSKNPHQHRRTVAPAALVEDGLGDHDIQEQTVLRRSGVLHGQGSRVGGGGTSWR